MKKVFVCAVLASFMGLTAMAQKSVGFHGAVNAGYVLSCSKASVEGLGEVDLSNRIAFEAIGGYQITPNFFAGVGVGGQYFHQGEGAWEVPVFADLKYDILNRSITPFVEAQIGYSFADWEGLYLNPQVGARFRLNEKLGLNVGAGYLVQKLKGCDGTSGDITFKVGIDF